jgi:hypothetical protein
LKPFLACSTFSTSGLLKPFETAFFKFFGPLPLWAVTRHDESTTRDESQQAATSHRQ